MRVIKPTVVTPSDIVSSTLVETEQAWNASTNYSAGSIVYEDYAGIYQAINANVNKKPSENPLDWIYLRPVNRWAMFDSQINTVSTAEQEISFTVKTGNLTGFALLNMVGNTVEVEVTNGLGGEVVYSNTQSLVGEVLDWYQYFFFDTDNSRNQAIFTDLPLNYVDTYLTVTVSGQSTVSIGTVTFGRISYIGSSEYGATSGITDYSIKDTDEFGVTTFVKRAYTKRMSDRVLINNAELNKVQRVLYDLRAVPALWYATENPQLEEALVVFGFYRDFSTDISYPNYSYCSIEIEGLI